VARSLDANSVLILAAALAGTALWGRQLIASGVGGARMLLNEAAVVSFDPEALHTWLAGIAWKALTALGPLLLLLATVGALVNLVQTGPVFSFQPLKPDLQRLNPIQGFKRIYSSKALYEAAKSILKLTLLAIVAYASITGALSAILGMSDQHPSGYPSALLEQTQSLIFKLTLVLALIALLDIAFVRWEYARKMRMSRREQKEEVKRREGDPHVRAKRRELQREAAKRTGALRRVPEADVLITNPTHLAVALKYERGRSPAPRCIAKGAGETALRMRTMAARAGVIVLERRQLARELFDEVDVDGLVPESLYEPVARLYAEIAARQRATLEVRA
jgi:flagellar biosynthetic protein FlhB